MTALTSSKARIGSDWIDVSIVGGPKQASNPESSRLTWSLSQNEPRRTNCHSRCRIPHVVGIRGSYKPRQGFSTKITSFHFETAVEPRCEKLHPSTKRISRDFWNQAYHGCRSILRVIPPDNQVKGVQKLWAE